MTIADPSTRILLLPGMTPDARIFDRLAPLLPAASIVAWIEPLPREPIAGYAQRLADSIEIRNNVIVCGVSFGGIIARHLALHVNAKACVLVSSPRDVRELPPWFRVFRSLSWFPLDSILSVLGRADHYFPTRLQTDSTARLSKLAGPCGVWYRWATAAVLRWNPPIELGGVLTVQIHGTRDATFPIEYVHPDFVVAGGGHLLPVTHAAEIAKILMNLAA